MKQKHLDFFMDTAKRAAELSTCKKLQVGAIAIRGKRIISIGYNGTLVLVPASRRTAEFIRQGKINNEYYAIILVLDHERGSRNCTFCSIDCSHWCNLCICHLER